MVVDDDDAVARLIQMVLDVYGYDTVLYDRAKACLEDWRTSAESADLLITDQTMPVMTGMELVQALRARGCQIPVIVASGFCEVATPEEKSLLEPMFLLTKPFTAEELAGAVQEALSGGRPVPA